MKVFDAHCDTAEKILDNKASLYRNNYHWDLLKASKYDVFSQVFAVCILPEHMKEKSFKRAEMMLDSLFEEIYINNHKIELALSYNDIIDINKRNKTCALISLEGGSPLNGDINNLYYFYNKGVRILTLTWNHRNELGCGAVTSQEEGLTKFGYKVIKEMNKLGMVIDVSHLSDTGFYNVLDNSKKPFMASHSNSRKLCDNKRNLTDDMIKSINEINGFIGINLYPTFISKDEKASIDDIIKHIEHISAITNGKNIGLGCDFDGVDKLPDKIESISDIEKIINRLSRLNYTSEFIEDFTYNNFLFFLKNIM